MTTGPLISLDEVPEWMRPLVAATGDLDEDAFRQISPPNGTPVRHAAVLILLGDEQEHGPDVLFQLRAGHPDDVHSGQVAFPGGARENTDDGPVANAIREAVEETGLRPEGVLPAARLPELYLPPSRFMVTPVLAYWQEPSKVFAADPAETAAVARVPLSHLSDPAHRFLVRHPSGFSGPGFSVPAAEGVPDMLVWGFTAMLLSVLLSIGGWEQPWDYTDVRSLDVAWRSVSGSGGSV